MAAFARQKFSWDSATPGAFKIAPWGTGALPATDEEIAFLPAHRLAAAIHARKLTSEPRRNFGASNAATVSARG